ncbi:hypothetical protein MTO96_001699 [Rhipicephalus appendiculatus]
MGTMISDSGPPTTKCVITACQIRSAARGGLEASVPRCPGPSRTQSSTKGPRRHKGQAFHVDRPLLIKHSQFFRKTLDRPENRNKHKLKLSGVSAATFAVLLKYMNTGELQVTPENVDDVFNAAFRLHMSDVVKHCIQMETETTPTGQQILMFSAARRLNMAEEEQRAYHFLTAHFMSVVATREFLELDADDVARLLSADALGCHW